MLIEQQHVRILAAVGAATVAVVYLSKKQRRRRFSETPRRMASSAWRRARSVVTYEQEEEEGDEQEWTLDAARSAKTVPVSGAKKLHSNVGYNQKLVNERQAAYERMQHIPRLEELDYKPSGVYMESSEEEALSVCLPDGNTSLQAFQVDETSLLALESDLKIAQES